MKSLAGQAEEPITDFAKSAFDLAGRAGPRSILPARLAGLATPHAPDFAGSLEHAPNGAASTKPHQTVPDAEAANGHVRHPIDIHVGARIRLRRQLLRMSQKVLAGELGITFQQVQKFERGINRIAAGRLHDAARALDVPISFFFDALPTTLDDRARPPLGMLPPAGPWSETGKDTRRCNETLNLARAYHTVLDPAVRKQILDLVRSLAPPPQAFSPGIWWCGLRVKRLGSSAQALQMNSYSVRPRRRLGPSA